MTIQELRQHQIVVQDPEIDRAEYDAVMQRLRELGEKIGHWEYILAEECISFDENESCWSSDSDFIGPTLTFAQFMNLEIEK